MRIIIHVIAFYIKFPKKQDKFKVSQSKFCRFIPVSHSKFAEGMRRSRINVKKSRQNYDC